MSRFGPTPDFWRDKRVFVTGHTGFKGSWLTLWLHRLGARVRGYSLPPETSPNAFEAMGAAELCEHRIGDVRDADHVTSELVDFDPHVVIHMAAQPLVRLSYEIPVETFDVNVRGTLHVLEACRRATSLESVVVVTTDKCYENREWQWSYRENDPLGGHDPYSASKACTEIATSSYRNSFFHASKYAEHGVALGSGRAGNVFGGGDWSRDRLIPDCVRAFSRGEEVVLRMPEAVRPWQHVLEPLSGYLVLARALCERGPEYATAWNFGPGDDRVLTTLDVVGRFAEAWGPEANCRVERPDNAPHEATLLLLDSGCAARRLGWSPTHDFTQSVRATVDWYRAQIDGADVAAMRQIAAEQCNVFDGLDGDQTIGRAA